MIKYTLKQYKNSRSSIFRKWLAYPVIEETLDLNALAKHMASHSSPYSEGVVRGVLTDMVKCIKEQLLEGKNVKIDDLAIFSLGIKNKLMADTEEEFTVSKNIEGVKLKARATGELMSKTLNLDATLKKATFINGKLAPSPASGSDPSTNSGGSTNTGGSPSDPTGDDEDGKN